MLAVNNINNVSFDGRFRYVAVTPGTPYEIFELGKNHVSRQLVDFSEKSSFLNKLKEDRDVFLFHHREINKTDSEQEKMGIFSKLFSNAKSKTESARIGDDFVSITFENKKAENPKDIEYCTIHLMQPVNKGTPDNLDRFERILENNSNIDAMRVIANKLFPNDTHKLTKLPNNSDFGYCEFWTEKRTASDALDKLFSISKAEIKQTYDQINNNIMSKMFGL